MTEFVKPSVEYFELLPMLVVFGVACLGVVVEAFAPRAVRYVAQVCWPSPAWSSRSSAWSWSPRT